MSASGYKFLIGALVLISLTSVGLFAKKQIELSKTRADIRYARDIVRGFHDRKDFAMKRGPTEAAEALYSLQIPPGSGPFQNPLADFIERERKRAVADLIGFLRTKTGKDFGDNPTPWILEFGDETIRSCQANLVESAKQ